MLNPPSSFLLRSRARSIWFAAMASSSFRRLSCLLVFVGFLSLLHPCACYSRIFLNSSAAVLATSPAVATWYGSPGGAGSEGDDPNPGTQLPLEHPIPYIHTLLWLRRVPCNYPGVNVAFKVDAGSNANYFAAVIEFEGGDGDLSAVDVQPAGGSWIPTQQSWGANWKLNSGSPLQAPLSIRLTSGLSSKTLVATNVIPVGWKPGVTYTSSVNY
ncbi:hypothetical protein BHE74_00024431 [Ensete ventricosum]|nr:hypothetical protein GW17_00030770 [Ensete ventricosum]RWW68064.1 hypothetical protein BHE74_00024431 [Ensete ventricosum]RZS07134.1 hypothetical protein BHM03_00037924 [Ensete ventricosum]